MTLPFFDNTVQLFNYLLTYLSSRCVNAAGRHNLARVVSAFATM